MIKAALQDSHSKHALIEYCQPLVGAIVDAYVKNDRAQNIPREELVRAGWTHFEQATAKYAAKSELMITGEKPILRFHDYFGWFVRQGIVERIISDL
jgi:hypothetical protein